MDSNASALDWQLELNWTNTGHLPKYESGLTLLNLSEFMCDGIAMYES